MLSGGTNHREWECRSALHLKETSDHPQAPLVHAPSSNQTTIVGNTADVAVEQPERVPLNESQKESDRLESHALEDDPCIGANSASEPLNRLPHKIAALLLLPILKMLTSTSRQLEDHDLRVQMFYASPTNKGWDGLFGIVVGTTFGGIHLLALMSDFTTHTEWLLWLIGSSIMIVTPISLFMMVHLGELIDGLKRHGRLLRMFDVIWKLEYTVMAVCYVASRFVIIALALRGIQHPLPRVVFDISWTSYIPHI